MSVISKVDEKVKHVISLLSDSYTEDEFLSQFKLIYPEEYKKCMAKFLKEERNTKPGKSHPMQYPDHHIKAALRSYLSRTKQQSNKDKK